MSAWTDGKMHALNPQEVAELFDLAPGAGTSCENPDCIRSVNHRGRCAGAEDFKRALAAVRAVDSEEAGNAF